MSFPPKDLFETSLKNSIIVGAARSCGSRTLCGLDMILSSKSVIAGRLLPLLLNKWRRNEGNMNQVLTKCE